MSTKIFPSTNDVGAVAGDGRIATEATLSDWRGETLDSRHRNDEKIGAGGVRSGFDFSSGTATSVTLTAGTAIIRGFKCEETASTVATLTISTFNYVFLALTKSADLVTGLEYQVRTAAAFNTALSGVPADSILLWVFETDGVNIIAQFDMRMPPSSSMCGLYVGDDAAIRTIDIGFRPKMVMLQRVTPPRVVTFSEMPYPAPGATNYGMFAYELATGDPCVVGISNNREARPQLEENGFSIEDGPATIPGGVLRATLTHDPPNLVAGANATQDVTVTGARVADGALANFELAAASDVIVTAHIVSPDTARVTFYNSGSGAVNLGSDTLIVTVFSQGGADDYKLNELNIAYFFVAWY